MKDEMTIPTTLFWQMYNALRDAESTLWDCDGATNPEDQGLTDSITEANRNVSLVLDKLQGIVKTLKEAEDI